MDTDKAKAAIKAALELHAGHINGTEPTSVSSQNKLMVLLETAFKALGGTGGPGGM